MINSTHRPNVAEQTALQSPERDESRAPPRNPQSLLSSAKSFTATFGFTEQVVRFGFLLKSQFKFEILTHRGLVPFHHKFCPDN